MYPAPTWGTQRRKEPYVRSFATRSLDAAQATLRLLETRAEPGVYHCVNSGHATWLEVAEEAARQWTANFNPRPVTKADFVALYRAALQPRE